MIQYELMDDFRTATDKAYNIIGIKGEELQQANSYVELFSALSPAKRQLAIAAVEVYKQFKLRPQTECIRCALDIQKYCRPMLDDVTVEECWVLLLNNSQRVKKVLRISVGGLTATVVDVRVIAKEAILANASAVALVHNHPSGSTRPSREDDRLTDQVQKGLMMLNIRLVDHVIFAGGDRYYSYSDEGRL